MGSVIYIDCLNVDNPNQNTGLSVGVSTSVTSGDGFVAINPAIEFSHPDIPFTLKIVPVFPYVVPGINWQFWKDLFGLGETRIEREKEQIQDVYTPIFRYLKESYGFPLHDNHALQFSSDYVQKMFDEDPFKKASASGMYQSAYSLAQSVFVDDTPSKGQRERIVNQFLANAHFNEWSQNAWVYAWNGLLDAGKASCRDEPGRFMKSPILIKYIAQYTSLLYYMPLGNFTSAVAQHKVGDKFGRKLLTIWLNNPQLVAAIPTPQNIPEWAVAYKSEEDGGGQSGNPYETQQIAEREPVQELFSKVQYQKPWYPDLVYVLNQGIIEPSQDVPPAPPPPQPSGDPVPPPWPDGNVVEIPPNPNFPQPWPDYPYCQPWYPPPQPQPDPGPGPQPDPEPPPQDGICDPDCMEYINYLLSRVQWLDNMTTLGLIPRLENLEDWVRDIESRLPGPQPPLPNPAPYPPWLPPPPTDPGDLPGLPPPDTEPGEEPFPEECKNKLLALCDDELFCLKVRDCERELECKEVAFCDEEGGPWGVMAECWTSKKTPPSTNLQGAYSQASLVDSLAAAMTATVFETLGGQGQGQGGGPAELRPYAQYWPGRAVEAYSNSIVAVWNKQAYTPSRDENASILQREWIFSDPASEEVPTLKYTTVKPHTGEVDPCAIEPPL